MERLTACTSEIAEALNHLLIKSAYPKRVSPPWDEVAQFIALKRFPKKGLTLRPTLISLAARRMIINHNPGCVNDRDIGLLYPGRPNLAILAHKSYGSLATDAEHKVSNSFDEFPLGLRETYKLLLVKPEDLEAHPETFSDYGEGIVLYGSPGHLYPYLQLKTRGDRGPAIMKDFPENLVSADASDQEKVTAMRVLNRIGFWN